MTNQLVTYSPQELSDEYNVVLNRSERVAQNIAAGVDLADLDGAAEDLAKVVLEIEQASKQSYSVMEKIPLIGSLLVSAKQRAEIEMIKRKTVEEVTTRMFDQLTVRATKLQESVGVLEDVEQGLILEEAQLSNLVGNSVFLLEDQSGMKRTEIMLCKDVGTKAGVSLMQNRKNKQIIDITVRAAMELSNEVSKQLPALKQALNSELTIAQSLNNLRQFKKTFDETTDAINKISDTNQDMMFEVVNDVIDVKGRDEKNLIRLKETAKKNNERGAAMRKKMQEVDAHKEKMHEETMKLIAQQNNAIASLGEL